MRRVRLILAMVGLLLLSTANTASGHPAADFYDASGLWEINEVDVCWGDDEFDAGNYPGTAGRNRVKDGHADWHPLDPALYFDFDGCETPYATYSTPCSNWAR